MYYNTTQETGEELKLFIDSNDAQEDKILKVFKHLKRPLTPFDVTAELMSFDPDGIYLVTSIRRAMTDLTSNGDLVKLAKKTTEVYGRPNHYWKLKN